MVTTLTAQMSDLLAPISKSTTRTQSTYTNRSVRGTLDRKSGCWRRERNWDRTFSAYPIVAQRTWAHLRRSLAHQTGGTVFELEPHGPITAKHERAHEMYFINRLKPEFSRDSEGRAPNEHFLAKCNRLPTGFSA